MVETVLPCIGEGEQYSRHILAVAFIVRIGKVDECQQPTDCREEKMIIREEGHHGKQERI